MVKILPIPHKNQEINQSIYHIPVVDDMSRWRYSFQEILCVNFDNGSVFSYRAFCIRQALTYSGLSCVVLIHLSRRDAVASFKYSATKSIYAVTRILKWLCFPNLWWNKNSIQIVHWIFLHVFHHVLYLSTIWHPPLRERGLIRESAECLPSESI